MKGLKNKAMVFLVFVLFGLALTSTPMVGYATGEGERPPLFLIRARGIAIDVDTEKIMLAGQLIACAALEPETNNLTLIPLFVARGVVRIGFLNYNITEGIGLIEVQRHALMLSCNGTTPEGEDFNYRIFGRFVRTSQGLRPTILIGMLDISGSLEYVLVFSPHLLGREVVSN